MNAISITNIMLENKMKRKCVCMFVVDISVVGFGSRVMILIRATKMFVGPNIEEGCLPLQ